MRIKKECKYIKKKLIRYIIDDLESFSDESDDSDNSDEKQIKAMKLMLLDNVLSEKVILKNVFLREQF